MDKFFSILGKVLVVLGIVGILVGGGYYLGTKFNKPAQKTAATVLPSPTTTQVTVASVSSTPIPSQQQADPHVAIYGGGISPFSKYLLSGFKSFAQTVQHSSVLDQLTLTSGDYKVVILQAAVGGGACVFPGDKPQAMGTVLTDPHEIPLLSGNSLKRGTAPSPSPNQVIYSICQKDTNGVYSTITDFGVINYYTSLNPDPETIAIMDAMVGSLQKQ